MCRLQLGYIFMATAACTDHYAVLLAIRVNRISTIRICYSDVCRRDRAHRYEHQQISLARLGVNADPCRTWAIGLDLV
jgi:hypothetical protein